MRRSVSFEAKPMALVSISKPSPLAGARGGVLASNDEGATGGKG
jgi:hypothetical protein